MENQNEETPSIYQHAIKFGVYLAVISIAMVSVIYVVDLAIMGTFKFLGLAIITGLGFVIYAGINFRNSIGGYIPFGQAFIHGIILLLISGLISTGFNILLYHVIDPDLPKNLGEAIITNTEETMRNWGAPEEAIDKAISDMESQMDTQFSVGNLMLGYFKAAIGYAIIALITSLIVRKNKPEMP
jgi:Flp pilus assembly pilin Flp